MKLSVAIPTKNRPSKLQRCFDSLSLIESFCNEVLIWDDGSHEPQRNFLSGTSAFPVRWFRSEKSLGCVEARNNLIQYSANEIVLNLDDDAYLWDSQSIVDAVELLAKYEKVAAVAMSQAKGRWAGEHEGELKTKECQPAPVSYTCFSPSFSGGINLLRRSVFLNLGGYRPYFRYMNEEAEFSKRLWAKGFHIVYLPKSRVVHTGVTKYERRGDTLRFSLRNGCFDAVLNEPWYMAIISIPLRMFRYWKARVRFPNADRGGTFWVLKQFLIYLPTLLRERRSLGWSFYRKWKKLKTFPMAFNVSKGFVVESSP